MTKNLSIRAAKIIDKQKLIAFLNGKSFVHRHLDWRSSIDWLGHDPFYLLLHESNIIAVLSCPADPPDISWIRLFSFSQLYSIDECWNILFQTAHNYFQNSSSEIIFAAVSTDELFINILQNSGFSKFQEIVVFERANLLNSIKQIRPELSIRSMEMSDLINVEKIDHSAFAPIWRLSFEGLSAALHQSDYASVLFEKNELIGYQISTVGPFSAHLARIAVHKNSQCKNVGGALLSDALNHYINLGYLRMSVNTQRDNHESISLYKKYNFEFTGEKYSVLINKQNF